MIRLILFVAVVATAAVALADSERMPEPLVFSSPSGSYYFRMEPSPDFDRTKSRGHLYRVSRGTDELVYESNGWYSFTVLVSEDGQYLARTGPWPRFNSPPQETPAVVFYKQGAPVKTYYVADLVDDLSNLHRSISHYSWGGNLKWGQNSWGGEIQVKTVEDRIIKFDIRTAEIIE